jgi:hypothetical protein
MEQMKWYTFLLILLIGFIIITIFQNPKPITRYIQGKTDTLIISDTVTVNKVKYKVMWDTTTIVINDSGKIALDSIRSHWQDFELKADTNIACLGKVRLNRSMFEFDSISITYPKVFINRVDTIQTDKFIEVNQPFYKDTWFWSTVGAVGIIITKLLTGV